MGYQPARPLTIKQNVNQPDCFLKMDNSSSSIGATANPINAIAVPIFCLLATLITYLPFRAFRRLGNFPACNLIVVNNIINIFYCINAVLWPNDNWSTWWAGYGLCDVEIILKSPLTVALACSLCRLTQAMANALDVDNAQFNTTAAMKRRKLMFDILACWGVPLWQICMHYTVQNGRYAIAPVFGCGDQLDTSWPVVFIYLIWFPPIMLLNLYYAGKSSINFLLHALRWRTDKWQSSSDSHPSPQTSKEHQRRSYNHWLRHGPKEVHEDDHDFLLALVHIPSRPMRLLH